MARILVADDDPKQAELVRRYAVAEGHEVTVVADGRAAVDEVRRRAPDLVVLDVMMPRMDGLDVCRVLRSTPESEGVPIILLTARSSEDDLLHGLDLGADDYVTKPYSPRELMARSRALLRRSRRSDAETAPPPISVGQLTVDRSTHEVRFRGATVACTPGEFALLEMLAAEPGRVFTRDQLLRRVHGADGYVSRRTVDVHIANLRKKLEPGLIRTVYGVGYAFAGGMTSARVPWHRSLSIRLFAVAALIAVVAVSVATWATVRSTAVAVRQEQQESLHTDAQIYDALVGYAATHRSWAGAAPLVRQLAERSGERVTVTDPDGTTLLDSTGATGRQPRDRARAQLDPLDVDPVLVAATDDRQEPAPVPQPATGACTRAPAECARVAVSPASTVDPRVHGPFDRSTRRPWTRLQRRVDGCLRREGLAPVLAVTESFAALVDYPHRHRTVAACMDEGRRSMLAAYVAPPALLFVSGDGGSADVFLDLSRRNQVRIGLLAGAVLLVTLALCAVLAGTIVRPLRRMALAAHRAADGDLDVRVDPGRHDEVGEVARAFNRLADRRQALEEARRRMVGDVSHELRAPLANVRGWIEAAQDGIAPTDAQLLASLHEESLHLQRLVDDLHDLSLADAGELRLQPEDVEVATFLGQVADSFRPAADGQGVTLAVDAAPGVVHADPVRLRQAVVNLVVNALRHTPAGGHVTLRGRPGVVAVADDGEGIPAEELPHVLERFRRVDPSRSRATGGSGLGLAIVKQIAEAHGGSVAIESAPGSGTTVTLDLRGSLSER